VGLSAAGITRVIAPMEKMGLVESVKLRSSMTVNGKKYIREATPSPIGRSILSFYCTP
jgi:DNA-binding MarR family transcriptional regulator